MELQQFGEMDRRSKGCVASITDGWELVQRNKSKYSGNHVLGKQSQQAVIKFGRLIVTGASKLEFLVKVIDF